MFMFVALAITLVVAIYFWQKSTFSFWIERGIPQLEPRFPLGTLKTDRHIVYHQNETYNAYKDRTKYVGMYNTFLPMLLVMDKDLIKTMLIKDFSSLTSHGTYHNERDDPLSAHLFSIEGQKWRDLRTKLTPTFTSGKMKSMCPIVVDIGQRLKDSMDVMIDAGKRGIDMREMFAKFTTDVIGTCAFGLECNSLKDPNAIFRKMGMKIFDSITFNPFVFFAIGAFPKLARQFRVRITPSDVSEFFLKAVKETIEHRTANNIKRNDFIDLLVALRNQEKSNSLEDSYKEGLSINEIAAQCFVFFAAGFETSSTASSFLIFELAKNQVIQDKLRTHIHAVLKKHNSEMSFEALKDMTYLEQCIKESLRLYPPVPMLTRRVTENYKIPDTNVVLPVGTDVSFPIYSIQRDSQFYPNPEQFNPDRFAPEEETKRHFSAWLPFGEGPRVCIGERFGMMQAKVGLSYLIGNYRFKLNAKTKPEITLKKETFILTPDSGLFFDVEKV